MTAKRATTAGRTNGRSTFAMCAVLASTTFMPAADLATAEKQFRAGLYDECIRTAAGETAKGSFEEGWWVLKARSEAARGKYADAAKTMEVARGRFPFSPAVLLLAYETHRSVGRVEDAAEVAVAFDLLIRRTTGREPPAARVAIGRYLLMRGADARKVLDLFFADVVKRNPEYLDAHYATAELALGKHDYALAAETLQKAPEAAAQEPHYHFLLARAFGSDDRAKAAKAVADALAINPRHADSLLLKADRFIDAEDYAAADAVLRQAIEVDPLHPRAWAYRAVLAHLRADPDGETAARKSALTRWPTNPEVDHLIGKKLSQDYRFAEGAAYQRKALEFDPRNLPAKAQLCQDLLRLGQEDEGWALAAELFAADGYDAVAFNLVTLKDNLAKFRPLRDGEFLVKMDPKEAELYGPRALAVLKEARKALTEKYGVELNQPVTVEIFPRKQDFAVRTFGLPGADGFLGVCFGPVITANSPASQGANPSNWEAVLWHEFCHTVTLRKTKNKMPRWLSEGISVYEELQENPSWGQWLTPRYREMILGDDLTPLSKLSSAFLSPKSALHVQFAYYESALAVEFLVRNHGFDALKVVLDDLGAGVSVNDALTRRTGRTLEKLDAEFAAFIRGRATDTAAGATWDRPDLPPDADSAALAAWVEAHPKSFWGVQRLAARFVAEKKWPEAEKAATELKALYPEYVGPQNAYSLLGDVYRETNDPAKEAAGLEELAAKDADAVAAFQRLAELAEAAGDWQAVARNARRMLAVNPLVPAPHRFLARAADRLGDRADAMAAYRALLLLGDPDATNVRYRLAVLLRHDGKPVEAKREVLKALEDAPRFRDAQKLLLELTEAKP